MSHPDTGQQGPGIDLELLRAHVAELAAALGQIEPKVLDSGTRERFDRAWTASRALTRLTGVEAVRLDTGKGADHAGVLPDLVGYRVLVAVPADADDGVALGEMLIRMGARYEMAGDGLRALDLLGEGGFDLALVDADLTGTPGAQVIKRLRRHAPPLGRIPVLGLCRDNAEAARLELRQAGADYIVATPLHDILPLAAALAGIIDGAGGPEDLPDQLLLDFDRYERLIEIAGPEGSIELLDRLQEDLLQVQRGLERALGEGNPAEVRTQTHVLIALAGAVGADALQRLSEALNAAAHRKTTDGMVGLGRQAMRQLAHLVAFVGEELQVKRDGG